MLIPDDVNFVVGTYNNLLTLDIDKIKNNPLCMGRNVDFSWNVYPICNANYVLDGVTGGTDSFTLNLQPNTGDVKVGDILGIVSISNNI